MDDQFLLGLGGLAVLIGLIAIRVPIAYAMILVGAVGTALVFSPAILLSQLKTLAFGQFSIYELSVVPFFVLMGSIATRAGLSRDLFRAANAWFGWMRGGVAMSATAFISSQKVSAEWPGMNQVVLMPQRSNNAASATPLGPVE